VNKKICKPTIQNGYPCTNAAGSIPCSYFSSCDNGLCQPQFSLSIGNLCTNFLSCVDGNCISNQCVSTDKVACYSNSDCVNFPGLGPKYCSSTDNKFISQGFCISDVSNSYYSKLSSCISNYCSSSYSQSYDDCINVNCMSQYVASQCATFCPLRPDQRYSTIFGDGLFDCQKLTKTIIPPNTCNTRIQFQNCFIPGIAYTTSFNLFLFISIMLLLL